MPAVLNRWPWMPSELASVSIVASVKFASALRLEVKSAQADDFIRIQPFPYQRFTRYIVGQVLNRNTSKNMPIPMRFEPSGMLRFERVYGNGDRTAHRIASLHQNPGLRSASWGSRNSPATKTFHRYRCWANDIETALMHTKLDMPHPSQITRWVAPNALKLNVDAPLGSCTDQNSADQRRPSSPNHSKGSRNPNRDLTGRSTLVDTAPGS